MSARAPQPESLEELYRTFIRACHILHHQGVLYVALYSVFLLAFDMH